MIARTRASWDRAVMGDNDRRSPAYVRWVQAALNRIEGADLPLDGTLSPRTRNALRAFQGRHGLPQDGVIGPRTERALLAAGGTGARDREAEALFEVDRRSPEYIRWVQQSLNDLDGAGLAVDGVRGPRTTAAVRRFQSRNGLTADGVVGPLTEAKLVAAGAPPPPGSSAGPPPRPPEPVDPIQPTPPDPQPCLDACWANFERCLRNTTFPPGCMAQLSTCQRGCGG